MRTVRRAVVTRSLKTTRIESPQVLVLDKNWMFVQWFPKFASQKILDIGATFSVPWCVETFKKFTLCSMIFSDLRI